MSCPKIFVNGKWTTPDSIYVKVNGEWIKPVKIFIRDGSAWLRCMPDVVYASQFNASSVIANKDNDVRITQVGESTVHVLESGESRITQFGVSAVVTDNMGQSPIDEFRTTQIGIEQAIPDDSYKVPSFDITQIGIEQTIPDDSYKVPSFDITQIGLSQVVSTDEYGVPECSHVEFILSMEGINGETTFEDTSIHGHEVVVSGDAYTSTVDKKFGEASYENVVDSNPVTQLRINNFSQLIGTQDFTIEGWFNANANRHHVICVLPTSSYYYLLYLRDTNKLLLYVASNTSAPLNADFTNDTWHHFALVRDGSTWRLFLDGVQTSVDTIAEESILDYIDIGGPSIAGVEPMVGNLDEMRLTIGFARYTENFTPPDAPFPLENERTDPYWDKVVLMMNMEGMNMSQGFVDLSNSAHTFAPGADRIYLTNESSYFGCSGLSTNEAGSDRANTEILGTPSDFVINDEDFTIEFFIQWKTSYQSYTIFSFQDNRLLLEYKNGALALKTNGGSSASAAGFDIKYEQWQHICCEKFGNDLTLYQDGVAIATDTWTAGTNENGQSWINNGPGGGILMWMDEFRFTKGYARYKGDFIPPVDPHPLKADSAPLLDPYWDNVVSLIDEI